MELAARVAEFFRKQNFVIVSTMDKQGRIHCSAKGLVDATDDGRVFLLDVYLKQTFRNLKEDARVSLTAINEDKFIGFTLQGRGKIIPKQDIDVLILRKWERLLIGRISNRVIKGIKAGNKTSTHFEAALPPTPQYLIEVDVDQIIDLVPPLIRQMKEEVKK